MRSAIVKAPLRDYTPRAFTRASPCTKVEIYNTFYPDGRYVAARVIEARTIMGLNAPKYLLHKGYMAECSTRDVDMYLLTKSGRDWLISGLAEYLARHPERVKDCARLPTGFMVAVPRKSRLKGV